MLTAFCSYTASMMLRSGHWGDQCMSGSACPPILLYNKDMNFRYYSSALDSFLFSWAIFVDLPTVMGTNCMFLQQTVSNKILYYDLILVLC